MERDRNAESIRTRAAAARGHASDLKFVTIIDRATQSMPPLAKQSAKAGVDSNQHDLLSFFGSRKGRSVGTSQKVRAASRSQCQGYEFERNLTPRWFLRSSRLRLVRFLFLYILLYRLTILQAKMRRVY
jgi:hypothetical protein